MRDDDDKENKGGSVTQDIEGENHQIAGRDIVNHYQDLRPKRLCDCNADQLRAEREWSRKIIADARRKIKSSWPYRFAHVSVPVWMLFVFWVWPSFTWVVPSMLIMVCMPLYFYAQVNEPEYKVIKRHEDIIQYVYDRLRDFGIDER